MQFILKLAFILTCLYETWSQTCTLKNTEYNLLTIVSGETYRLPLSDYFTGDGLSYTIEPAGSPFSVNTALLGNTPSLQGTIISSTSSNFNNNPNIQQISYFALTLQNGQYQIFRSQVQNGQQLNYISYNIQFATIPAGANIGSCYSINFIQNLVVLTCTSQGTNYLNYIFYSSEQNGVQLQPILYQYPTNYNIAAGSTVITQAVGQFVVTIVGSQLFVFQLGYTLQLSLSQVLTNIQLQEGDVFTGISLQEDGILFISSKEMGFAAVNLQTYPPATSTNFNPFNTGTLGVSAYSVDYSQSFYYLSIWSAQGIVAGVFNAADLSTATFKSAQVIQTTQIPAVQTSLTQVFMNSRFLIVSNQNGISVYPSVLNDINNWQLLYYFTQNVESSAFDYYNNILVTVSGQTVSTYQFNNPTLINTIQTVNTENQNIKITAVSNLFGVKTQQQCQTLTLYYNFIQTQVNALQIYQASQVKSSKQIFVQSGPLFNIYLGSIQVVNVNKMLIGPAIIAGDPTTRQAYSNIDIQFSNVLDTPQINSPYRVNSNLVVGQKIIYSQVFYDASYIMNDKSGQFQDTYLQLVQVQDYILLYQCEGLGKLPCKQIAYLTVKNTLVKQFALSFSPNNAINIAYLWNEVSVEEKALIESVTICQLQYPYNTVQNQQCNTVDLNWNNQEYTAQQIALVQNNFYILYTDTLSGTTYFAAATVSDMIDWDDDDLDVPESFQIYNNPQNLQISSFTFNVPAYGNVIFLNTWNAVTVDLITTYYYYVTSVNFNGGYLSPPAPSQYQLQQVGIVQSYSSDVVQATMINYQFTMDGMYFLLNTTLKTTLTFYPRIDLLPLIFISQYPNAKLPVNGVQLNLYGIQNIVQMTASARFYYLMAMSGNTFSIYVYKNTPSLYNALYYVISTDTTDQIVNAPFSVVSAIKYDGILFKSKGNDGYRASLLLPEYEFVVKCNLNSNFQDQLEYGYVTFKASTLLSSPKLPANSEEYFTTFQSINLISFVKELSMSSNGGSISSTGFTQVDPRTYFQGNIQSFTLSNGTNDTTFYFFNISSPIQRQPQTTNYQNPATAVSAYMQISDQNTTTPNFSTQYQYWFTFVQTDRLVYVTPYTYYNPPPDFVKNSTIQIDYPLIYKLPVLDITPNSQKCPLIFVDSNSKGIVSVCGSKVRGKFLVSFTLFNPLDQKVLETKLINLNEAFEVLGQTNPTDDGTYNLQSAQYLDIGVVVLQFQYNYNYGIQPPTLVVFSFLYTSSLTTRIASYPSNTTFYYYQFIQPIPQVYQVPDLNLGSQVQVTPFSISNQYFGGLNNGGAAAANPNMIFGMLCVSSQNSSCLQQFGQQNAPTTSGAVITVIPQATLESVFLSKITVDYSAQPASIQIKSKIFQPSLLDVISDFTKNSIQLVVQAGVPIYELNNAISAVPLIAVSQGTAYVITLQFYLNNAQYIQSQYACTLLGLSDENRILQVSASSQNGQYQVVAVVSNPTSQINNQVTLLNYGNINQFCGLNQGTAPQNQQSSPVQDQYQNLVTAIGTTTYRSVEATPILALMQPPFIGGQPPSQFARTLISDNQVITLLDTSPYLTIAAFPNYNLKGGVTLNSTGLFSNVTEPLTTSISAMSVQTNINNQPISGYGGSSLFSFGISNVPINSTFPDSVFNRKIWGQFIWGFIMFVIIVGVIVFLFYKSQPKPYDRL